MNLQRLCLSQKHLAEVFSAEKNTTVLTDETSKFGNKFMGFEASDSKGNLWVLGLRDIETKSAEDTLKVLKEIQQDLNEISDSVDNSVSKDILKHVSATLSDRAATEVKFNNILESYRAEILPLVYANFDQFSDQEKRSVENLCNFFCGLHSLVNFAVAAQSSITEVEKGIFNGPGPIFDKSFLKECEPGTCRLVRTASKAFASGSGADEKSGCQGPFREYIKDFLKEKKLHALPLKPYRGSRFNILFENASSIYFLNRQLKLFLESYGASNRLLKSILHDLKTPEFIAGVKALGLICTFITCPLWHILEDKSVSIIDMNTKYLQLTKFFIDASENTEDFMKGKLLPFGDDTYIVEDHIYTCLMEPSEYDGVVQTYLQVLFLSLGKLSNTLFKDHLPGGKLVGMDPTAVAKFKCTPKTSCFAESVFGQLDHLLKSKPNLSTLAAEAYITFSNNKTLNWLLNKPELKRNILIEEASKNVKTVRKKIKQRRKEIEESRRLALEKAIKKREDIQQEKIKKQEEYTKSILNHGLWQTSNEIDSMILSYKTKTDKIDDLNTQLKFRKDVLLQQPEEKQTFNITKKREDSTSRVNLTVEELTLNLKKLIKQAIVMDQQSGKAEHILVGKRVRHKFKTTVNGEVSYEWYAGKVISQVPWFPDWFNIIYDNDSAVYTYNLLRRTLTLQNFR